MISKSIGVCVLAFVLGIITRSAVAQAAPSIAERVIALKSSLAASQASLRQYEWIETTTINLNGEEKSQKQQRCYYGADGVLQKVDIEASPPTEQKRGLRGRIIAHKTAELTDYMKSAVSLVKSYVPPDPSKFQAAKDTGSVSVDVLEPGKRVRINFHNYLKPGDNLGVQIDITNNRVLGLTVSTYLSYLDAPQDAVTLNVNMSALNDGTTYASDTTLTVQAKNLTVMVQNTGYRKMN